jgi:hypothetical protein
MLVSPAEEWGAIASEYSTTGRMYRGFLVPLAAIGPAAATLGTIVFGVHATLLAGTYSMPVMDALATGILDYLLSLAAVFLLALAIDALAPTFGGQRNPVQALKVAAYGSTPYWLGGVCAIIPKLTILGVLVSLYSFRLWALGLHPVMKAPRDRTAP